MRTKEFIKQVTSLGYEVDIKHGEMRISWYGKECVCIDLEHQFGIYIYWRNLGNNGHRLFVICMEYARTPIEAREEEKKYYLRLKNNFYQITYAYLTHDIQNDDYFSFGKHELKGTQNKFTQKEIDEIKKKYNTDLEEFKQIPIEEIEAE